ncbi:MAG TPA: helix-turn-helix transcriptional regulator [Glaciihabitans sp.]|jgi:DNA-binding XRE family transcriptional regulator|nr:helix-turn-helix transcriptional regulator [Glaciihabitans sp.]
MPKQKPDEVPQFFTRLPVLRAERGLSRKDVADAVGVHYQTVGYLERGEYSPSLVLALRIADYLRLPLDAVFSLRPFTSMSEQIYPRPADAERPRIEE